MAENQERVSNDKKRKDGVSIRVIGAIAIVLALIFAFFAFTLAGYVADIRDAAEINEKRYIECSEAVNNLQEASDYLTTQARTFVVTGRSECMEAYLNEINVDNRRANAVETLRSNFSDDQAAAIQLAEALAASDELAQDELTAMRLAADYYGIQNVPDLVANANTSMVDSSLSQDEKLAYAVELMFGPEYDKAKKTIQERVNASSDALLEELNAGLDERNTLVQNLLFQLRVSVALLLCVIMVLVLALLMYVLKPLDRYIKRIKKNEPLEAAGAYELHYLANAYNAMYEDNNKRIEQLRAFAERDPLTGISNRNGYDNFLATHTRNIALLLIDIDNFKEFNNVYGFDTGNAVLIKLANALSEAFRSTDFPCRFESDKFAVVMTNMNEDLHDAVISKIELVNAILADDPDDLPLITFSVGVAFSTEGMDDQAIYRAAAIALQKARAGGRNGIAFYGEQNAL